MKKVYVIKYIPQQAWVKSRSHKNVIELSDFSDAKIYGTKPDLYQWFKAYHPISIKGESLITINDFAVNVYVIEEGFSSILAHLKYWVYTVFSFLFKCLLWPFKSILNYVIIPVSEFYKHFRKIVREDD